MTLIEETIDNMEKNILKIIKGLFKDSNPQDQPKESYRFGLNTIIETDQGDNNVLSNEESNKAYGAITPGFVPLGKIYMNNNRVLIFSVTPDNLISEFGVYFTDTGDYVVEMNDEFSIPKDKLNFNLEYQIQGTYRLRGGCEDTVYWTDNHTRPKYYNFAKAQDFKNQNGNWVNSKFNLQRTYKSIPNWEKTEVLDSGGALEPGSYNFAIQYLDESLNPTEWINASPTVKINNDLSTKEYAEIRGSINSDSDYINFPKTGKSIKLELNNLDNEFLYYRVAIITSNNGSGLVNNVFYSENIPTSKDFYIYTGENHVSKGTVDEIMQFTDIVETALAVEQLDNTLILAGLTGKQGKLCKLQKYASKIKADCVVKRVTLNDIKDESNSKNLVHEFNNGLGYMPGEIYSFGIVYIFNDRTVSPAYHIAGKQAKDKDKIFSKGSNLHPMAANNTSLTNVYTDNDNCDDSGFWGLDYNGTPLVGKNVRHHRFPLRSEIGVPLINTTLGDQQETTYYNLRLSIVGKLKTPVPCPTDTPNCGSDKSTIFNVRVKYKSNGEDYMFTETVDPQSFADGKNAVFNLDIDEKSIFHIDGNFNNVVIQMSDVHGEYQDLEIADWTPYFTEKPTIEVSNQLFTSTTQTKSVRGNILGIKFSGIEKPSLEETGGLDVIGYYIVRHERTEFEKTIIDSAVIFPTTTNKKYIASGLIQPQTTNVSPDVYSVIHPEHKFNNKEYVSYDKLIQEGNYVVEDRKFGKVNYDDVYDGSSYDKKAHKDGNDDGHDPDGSPISRGFDGWSFTLITRDNILDYTSKSNFNIDKTEIKEKFYLDALGNQSINDGANEVFNIACDNKIGIIQTKDKNKIPTSENMPYVVMYKENSDPYANFRILPYTKETLNPVYFDGNKTSERSIFNGDTYITPMRYVNTMYWENRVAKRKGKSSTLKIILGGILAIIGAVLAIPTGGASAIIIGAGVTLLGAGALLASSGIKTNNYNRAYAEEYEKGLRQTALDNWTDMFYNFKPTIPFGFVGNGKTGHDGPADDTIEWLAEAATDLWFESSVNMNLRNGFVDDVTPTFLSAPGKIESGNNAKIDTWEYYGLYYTQSNAQRYPVSALERYVVRKLLAFDDTRDDNRYYLGMALGEYYNLNPDYVRREAEKKYFHLPLEYDCCSDCQETFPHRWRWSAQSFQEELSDNYRVFLPNNYRDLDGETGKITNIFRLGPDLFIHTEEALWQTIRSQQERITDQVVSFIGTGELYSMPPRKIMDDDTGNSAGCKHRWSTIKTPAGVFFVTENQNKIYQFTGKNLKAISNTGLSSWFKNELPIKNDKDFFQNKKMPYPFRDNPSNPFGTGFISTYDSRKERILFTKKDRVFKDLYSGNDFELCSRNGTFTIFKEVSETIYEKSLEGWIYAGLKDCKLQFKKRIGITTNYEYSQVEGEEVDISKALDNSWTLSYSLKNESWTSWHSYIPDFYINVPEDFFSWKHGKKNIWKHNDLGKYQNFYGDKKPFIVELVSVSNPLTTRIWEYIELLTEAKKYNPKFEEFVDEKYITFNKGLFYNTRQCSGILNFVVKDMDNMDEDYMLDQVRNLEGDTIMIDRNERNWAINQLRDIRTNYKEPIFKNKLEDVQENYFIDKVLNENAIDYDKDWTELESFRDKYLVIRLIFDNFEDVKLLLNYSIENEQQSHR